MGKATTKENAIRSKVVPPLIAAAIISLVTTLIPGGWSLVFAKCRSLWAWLVGRGGGRSPLARRPLDRRIEMREHSKRFEGPAPEAYSHVTNPQRFLPLHRMALERLEQLQSTFDAERQELDSPDPDIKMELAVPSVRLVPRDPAAAPVVVAFASFPGLYLRCGRWLLQAFPSCGCDACDETADEEGERFLALLDDVVAGRFRESIEIPAHGEARLEWGTGAGDSWTRIDRQRAHELIGTGPSSFAWRAWPRRPSRVAAV